MAGKRGAIAFLGVLAIVAASFAFIWMSSDVIKGVVQMSANEPLPLYKLYNPTNGDHAYTSSESVKSAWIKAGYNDEGILAYIPSCLVQVKDENTAGGYKSVQRAGAVNLLTYISSNRDRGFTTNSNSGFRISGWLEEPNAGCVYNSQKEGSVPLWSVHQGSIDYGLVLESDVAASANVGYAAIGIEGFVYPTKEAAVAATSTTETGTTQTTIKPATDVLVDGSFDGISSDCSYISGWACNPSNPDLTLNVQALAFAIGGATQGRVVGDASVPANIPRGDAVAARCGGNGARGFKISLPINLINGVTIKVYSLRNGERYQGLSLAGGANMMINCRDGSQTIPPASVATIDTTANYMGSFDGASCASVSGWACNTKKPNSVVSISVHSPIGVEVASGLANANSGEKDDIAAIKKLCGSASGAHRFTIPIPEAWKTDNVQHDVVVYPVGKMNADGTPVPVTGGNGEIVVHSVTCNGGAGATGTATGAGTATSCSDSDGGKDLGVAGIVTYVSSNGVSGTQPDYCFNSGSVAEFFCENNNKQGGINDCPAGTSCNDGACLAASTTGGQAVTGTNLLRNGVRCSDSSECMSGNCYKNIFQKLFRLRGFCRQ